MNSKLDIICDLETAGSRDVLIMIWKGYLETMEGFDEDDRRDLQSIYITRLREFNRITEGIREGVKHGEGD